MKLAMIGLGRMGANMVERLLLGGHECVVYDRDPDAVAASAARGASPATSVPHLVAQLATPRIVWLMLPAGEVTETMLAELAPILAPGDVVIDGGNTYFKDDIRRAEQLATQGIEYVDVGTSGGVWGRERGYCLMVGGSEAAFRLLEPLLATLAPGRGTVPPVAALEGSTATEGYLHCGPHGAGHFVKMVHNGIEYGLMQAYAEGFELMHRAADPALPERQRLPIDVAAVAELWRRGSVVSSWLLDLTARALQDDPDLEGWSGHVADSGEGRWTVQTAIEQAVPVPVLSSALFARFRSRQRATFADRLLSALRQQFGGHAEAPPPPEDLP